MRVAGWVCVALASFMAVSIPPRRSQMLDDGRADTIRGRWSEWVRVVASVSDGGCKRLLQQ